MEDEILRGVFSRNAILFLGAGFALDARNAANKKMPGVAGLSFQLLNAIGHADAEEAAKSANLPDVADYCFDDHLRRDAAVSRLRELFTVGTVEDWQVKLLTNFPWKRIYTTNYDNSVEFAFAAAKKSLHSLSGMQPYERPPNPETTACVVHLNGVASHATSGNIDTQLRLSGKSYALNPFQDSRWADVLRTDVIHSDVTIFVGFSLGDLEIAQVLINEISKGKTFFVNGTTLPVFARSKLSAFGTVIDQDGSQFTADLIKQSIGVTFSMFKKGLTAFQAHRRQGSADAPRDEDRRNLLIYGLVNDALLQSATLSPNADQYLVRRGSEQSIIQSLRDGADVAIHSALGNGKTILLERLSALLHEDGWNVFTLKDVTADWMSDVEAICASHGKTAVLIDSAASCLRIIGGITARRSPNLRLVIAERTRTFQVWFTNERLESWGVAELHEFEPDVLDDAEVAELESLISTSALWGKRASLTKIERRDFLTKKLPGTLASALLHVVKSPEIRSRIEDALKKEALTRADLEVLAVATALCVFGYRVPIAKLGRLCGNPALNHTLSLKTEFRDHLYQIVGGEFRIRSKIFGGFFLRELVRPEVVLAGLSAAIRSSLRLGVSLQEDRDEDFELPLDAGTKVGERSFNFPAPMYVFRNVQLVVNAEEHAEEVYAFFERIKGGNKIEDNPLYWLQYAIARFFGGDKATAKICIDNAYGVAERVGFRPYQIDNQYARWLLDSAVNSGSSADAFDAFEEAHHIIVAQIAEAVHAHYPFRIATDYYEFYVNHRYALTSDQSAFVRHAAATVADRLRFAQVDANGKRWIDRCRIALHRLEKAFVADAAAVGTPRGVGTKNESKG
jgi:hypothetical protein